MRKVVGLEAYITIKHVEYMNIVIMLTGNLVGIAYLTELFMAWYSGVEFEQYAFLNRATGPYWWAYWSMMTCNVISPQLMWFKKLRTNIVFTFILALFVNIGMWFERFVIIVTSLHRDYLPSSWSMFSPTFVDIGIFVGSIGFFFVLFLLYSRTFPVIAQAELKTIVKSSSEQYKKVKDMSKKVVYGIYDDEEVLLTAVKEIRSKDISIKEVYTPFPVHGLDHALGLERTRLAITAFIYGAIGLVVAFSMTYYIMIADWPQNIGGKPSFAYYLNMPAFVPILFEMTVLFAAHLMVITYFFRSKLFPGQIASNPDVRTTDDKFLMEVESDDESSIKDLMKKTGASEINVKEIAIS